MMMKVQVRNTGLGAKNLRKTEKLGFTRKNFGLGGGRFTIIRFLILSTVFARSVKHR